MEREAGELTGYDKVASLMTQHDEMAMFQRFDYLNTLNTLYLQAELVFLEQKIKDGLRGDLCMKGSPASEVRTATPQESTDPRVATDQPPSNTTSSQDGLSSPISLLPDPARDWYDLSTMKETSEVWKTILQARTKLKEYSSFPFPSKALLFTSYFLLKPKTKPNLTPPRRNPTAPHPPQISPIPKHPRPLFPPALVSPPIPWLPPSPLSRPIHLPRLDPRLPPRPHPPKRQRPARLPALRPAAALVPPRLRKTLQDPSTPPSRSRSQRSLLRIQR